jgi:ParB family chromosome partitioning protein
MSAKKRVLGRGLDALLGTEEPGVTPNAEQPGVQSLPVNALRPNPYQPRKTIRAEGIEELSASILEKGVLQPLIVRQRGENYEIVAGERRWLAAQRANLPAVPVIVREFEDREMLELALIENLQREDLSPVEQARAFRQLIEEFELTQEQVADRVGKSRVSVTNLLRILRLPDQILKWIEEGGALSMGHARALLSLDNPSLQLALAREIMSEGLSVREVERRVRRLLKAPHPMPKVKDPEVSIETSDLEEKLSLHIGLQVKIYPKSNTSGKIEVYYSSLDEFQRFFDHLGISLEREL